ncbi:MAG: AAA family ATPase [Candidatus Peribacteria bacterium]|nr:AAA family ATPase [Candidatus Peribacteria bacterium]
MGKTTLLQQIQQTFTRKNPININFELLEFEHLLEYHTLNDFLEKKIQGGSNALFLDEIQRVNSREKTINSLNTAHPEVQIFITGSNGSLLSGELATYLRGRYLEYYVNPFTYTEYCEFYQKSKGYESF